MDKSTGDPTDPRWFRQVLGQYPTGVCVVTATEPDGGRAGFVVGSFTSVSLDPPLVAFFPDRGSTSWPRIHSVGRFCVNILSAEQEDVCRNFATRKQDKFDGHRLPGRRVRLAHHRGRGGLDRLRPRVGHRGR